MPTASFVAIEKAAAGYGQKNKCACQKSLLANLKPGCVSGDSIFFVDHCNHENERRNSKAVLDGLASIIAAQLTFKGSSVVTLRPATSTGIWNMSIFLDM